jgi:hypothetical protein
MVKFGETFPKRISVPEGDEKTSIVNKVNPIKAIFKAFETLYT